MIFAGWTDFHWRDLVLVATDPKGRAWSVGEIHRSTGKAPREPLNARVKRVVFLHPVDGEELLSFVPDPEPMVPPFIAAPTVRTAYTQSVGRIRKLGGEFRKPGGNRVETVARREVTS